MSETTTRTEARKLAKTVESVLQSNAEAERYNVLTDVLEMVLEDAEARGAQRERERCVAAVQALYDATPHKRHADGRLNFEYDSGFDQGREDGLEDAIEAIENPTTAVQP